MNRKTTTGSNNSSTPTKRISEQDMMHRCICEGISVYPVPVKGSEGQKSPNCYIYVNRLGKVEYEDYIYKQDKKMWQRIYEIYRTEYNKIIGKDVF